MARWEWTQEILLARLLEKWLPDDAFFSATDGVARSPLSGWIRKQRGCKTGLPDMLIWCRHTKPIAIELKSPSSRCSRVQRAVRLEMLAAGCWWAECRTASAAMAFIAACGLKFRQIVHGNGGVESYRHPVLAPWEQFRTDPKERRPLHPMVRKKFAEANRRYRLRKELRAREAAKSAQERNDDAGDDAGDGIAAQSA
jgi:hypothetical protein